MCNFITGFFRCHTHWACPYTTVKGNMQHLLTYYTSLSMCPYHPLPHLSPLYVSPSLSSSLSSSLSLTFPPFLLPPPLLFPPPFPPSLSLSLSLSPAPFRRQGK